MNVGTNGMQATVNEEMNDLTEKCFKCKRSCHHVLCVTLPCRSVELSLMTLSKLLEELTKYISHAWIKSSNVMASSSAVNLYDICFLLALLSFFISDYFISTIFLAPVYLLPSYTMSLARISAGNVVLDEPKLTVIGTRHIKH
jgi:hypothetical protein